MINKLYKFFFKSGNVVYSRHKKPDFAYTLSDDDIVKFYKREEVTDTDEIAANTWGVNKK